jgi:DNA polymerase
LEGIENLSTLIQEEEKELLKQVLSLTGGYVNSVRQRDRLLSWLHQNGVGCDDVQKATVIELLKGDLPPNVRRVLEIRQRLGRSSVAKLKKMRDWACEDGKIRGSILYHGASTGRFSGKGIQPQNYPKDCFEPEEVSDILLWDKDTIEMIFGDVFSVASRCLRGMLIPSPGHVFYVVDFNSIEARVLAWLAGEKSVIDAFKSGKDFYRVAASGMYGIPYDEIGKDSPERFAGKTAVLACGYQGGVKAFTTMARNLGLDIPEDKAKSTIWKYREANPNIVRYWGGIENAAYKAIKTGDPYSFGRIKYGVYGGYLFCRLPSGRKIAYYNPGTEKRLTPYDEMKDTIRFYGMNSMTKKWCKQFTYGGKLVENIVQAVARDFLRDAMLRLNKNGYKIVSTVHDEIICEVKNDNKTTKHYEDFVKIVELVPQWGDGCPIKAGGYVSTRYKK